MKFFKFLRLVGFGVVVMTAAAPLRAELPILEDGDLLGSFVGVDKRKMIVVVGSDGRLEVIPRRKDDSLHHKPSIQVRPFIEEQAGPQKWVSKKFDPLKMTSEQEASSEPEDISIIMEASNGAKLKVNYYYKGKDVFFDADLIEKGNAKGELRFGMDVVIPQSYYYHKLKDIDKLKKTSRGDKVSFFTKKKKVKAKVHELMNKVLEKNKEAFESEFLGLEFKLNFYLGTKSGASLRPEGPASMTYIPKTGASDMVTSLGKIRLMLDPKKSAKKGPWAKITAS